MFTTTKTHLKLISSFTIILFLSTLINCTPDTVDPINGTDGLNGFNALVDIQIESEGQNCTSGGLRISIGQDTNGNNQLDESEIESISFICNGLAGTDGEPDDLLAKTLPELPGDNCEFGGTLIEIGNDTDKNGELDDNEVISSFFICNGTNGNEGANGSDGYSSIIKATTEPTGANCSNGGLKIEIGSDANDNLALDTEEIQSTYYICDGSNGNDGSNGKNGLSALSNIISEPAGTNCDNGGFRLQVGLDSNGNNSLDLDEVSSENYICNGIDGTNGNNGVSSLIKISSESSGTNCATGGMKIEIGLDDSNINGELDNDEVDFTQYICNGENGLNTIIETTTEDSGTNCANGGIMIQLGLDSNGNSIIDSGEEINSPFFICNGLDGVNGSDGQDVIVISTEASSCANGGSTLEFGHDGNNDGDLEDDEDSILSTITICNGVDGSDGSNGYNTIILTEIEEPGDNCSNGGLVFNVGLDENSNNEIDTGEEVGTYYVCNGQDGSNGSNGLSSLINISTFSGALNGCADGGLEIEIGIDANRNGTLDPTEVDATEYICNGSDGNDGSDGSDGSSDDVFEFYFQEGFDGYSGVVDLSISDKNGNENGTTFSVDLLNTPSNGLLYFPEIDRIGETLGTDQFEIVEAILYLKGRSSRVDGATVDNLIGVKTFKPEVPLFNEAAVTWTSIDGSQNWDEPGGTSNSADGDANPYSDMFRLPHNVNFNGFIPLLLNKTEIKGWTNKDENKGLVLLMADDSNPYELDIVSSAEDKNKSERPLLYIKAKISDGRNRSESLTHNQLKEIWNQKSYKEKLAPLNGRN